MPDDDVLADRYLLADAALTAAGLHWYEVSNWAASEAARCRHNLAYWTGGDWWGIGPGAHSHVGGVRWWNVKHPAAYAAALAAGRSPGHARELLDPSGPADGAHPARTPIGGRHQRGHPDAGRPGRSRAVRRRRAAGRAIDYATAEQC